MAAITNDIYTIEDAKILSRTSVLPEERIVGIETGGCPHTAIREDTSMNHAVIEELIDRGIERLELSIVEGGPAALGDAVRGLERGAIEALLRLYHFDAEAVDREPYMAPSLQRSAERAARGALLQDWLDYAADRAQRTILTLDTLRERIRQAVQGGTGVPLAWVVERQGRMLELTVEPRVTSEGRQAIGRIDAYVGKPYDAAYVVRRAHELTQVPESDGTPRLVSAGRRRRVMVVDGRIDFRHRAADALRKDGHDVIIAESGTDAMRLLEAQPVDCILLDLEMPGLEGPDWVRAVRSLEGTAQVAVVGLTAGFDAKLISEALAVKVDAFCSKTEDIEVLRAQVRTELRRRAESEQSASHSAASPHHVPHAPGVPHHVPHAPVAPRHVPAAHHPAPAAHHPAPAAHHPAPAPAAPTAPASVGVAIPP